MEILDNPFYGKCHKVDFLEKGVLWIKDDKEDIQGTKKTQDINDEFSKKKSPWPFLGALGFFRDQRFGLKALVACTAQSQPSYRSAASSFAILGLNFFEIAWFDSMSRFES